MAVKVYIGEKATDVVSQGENVFIHPENSTFPTKQVEWVESILRDFYLTNATIVTNSPYILSRLNNYIVSCKLPTWNLFPKTIEAFYVADSGEITSIIDRDTGLIGQNQLDAVSEELADEFDYYYSSLMELINNEKN